MQIETVNTINLVCKYIELAEVQARKVISDLLPGADEETITQQFQTDLHGLLHEASNSGEIERAFAMDIGMPGLPMCGVTPSEIASGLIAEVSWHPKHVEGRSGGDFGLVFARPKVEFDSYELLIRGGVSTGLLVQAKRKKFGEKTGRLSEQQEQLLASRLGFTSILVYELCDRMNRILAPFRWHICQEVSMEELIDCLKNDSFPLQWTMNTTELLRQLSADSIGTNDETVINEVISPARTRAIKIEIKWKHGYGLSTRLSIIQKDGEMDDERERLRERCRI